MAVEQLVLPEQCRKMVLKLAHTIHGQHKTTIFAAFLLANCSPRCLRVLQGVRLFVRKLRGSG